MNDWNPKKEVEDDFPWRFSQSRSHIHEYVCIESKLGIGDYVQFP